MSKKFIVGDLHGSYDKLMKALDNAKFSDEDTLYCTGDIGDRGNKIYKTLDFVMSLGDRFKSVFGNHDIWAYEYLNETISREAYDCWDYNGGYNTYLELKKNKDRLEEFKEFYGSMPYVIEEDTFRIMHTPTYKWVWERSNIDIHDITLANLNKSDMLWDMVYDEDVFDRSIIYSSKYFTEKVVNIKDFNDSVDFSKLTIVGHTPLKKGVLYDREMNLICVDTAGFCNKSRYGFNGSITVMDLNSFEWFNSNNENGKII